MICQRSGHCCIHYDVVIVDDPDLGMTESNLKHKPSGIRCQHLIGESPGEYSCGVHSQPWYIETPCFSFSQVEKGNTVCRVGRYILENKR